MFHFLLHIAAYSEESVRVLFYPHGKRVNEVGESSSMGERLAKLIIKTLQRLHYGRTLLRAHRHMLVKLHVCSRSLDF